MSKEDVLRKFVLDVEAITSSKIIGLDFIALGDDDEYYYQDYLLHSKEIGEYLHYLDKNYFDKNPSLLLTGLVEELKTLSNQSCTHQVISELYFDDPKIPKSNFTKKTKLEKPDSYYFDLWCSLVSKFYPYCNSIYFIKEGFYDLVQTTALFIYFNEDISQINKRNKIWLKKASKALLYEEAISVFLPRHIEEIKLQSTRTAISQILVRNTSHNIGHVSPRSTHNKIRERLCIDEKDLTPDHLLNILSMKDKLERLKDGRNEFIASFNSNVQVQNFGFYNEVIRPFIENTLMFDNIAKNEGISFKGKHDRQIESIESARSSLSQFVIRVYVSQDIATESDVFNGFIHTRNDLSEPPEGYNEQIAYYFGTDQASESKINCTSHNIPYYPFDLRSNEDLLVHPQLALTDISVGLPGGLGKHALYSMLENFIRNLAKHSFDKSLHKDKPIEVILKITSIKDDSGYYDITLTDNISDGSKVGELNRRLKADITEQSAGLGLADMKICACLLAGKELNRHNLKNSLSVCKEDGCVAYKFQILKPKEVLLIGCFETFKDEDQGIVYFDSLDSFLESDSKMHSFNFCIIHSSEYDVITYKEIRHQLPRKTIIFSDTPFKDDERLPVVKNKVEIEKNSLSQWCWETWLSWKFDEKPINISFYFEQAEKEELTTRWISSSKDLKHDQLSVTIHHKDEYDEAKITPPIKANKSAFHIIFDRHAKLMENIKGIGFTKQNYWSLIDKNNPDFDLISSIDIKNKYEETIPELAEAALMNVLVIDERVAEVAHQNYQDDTAMRGIVKKGGFRKYSDSARDCQVFDACWAANIHIATHVDGIPVHNNIKDDDKYGSSHHFNKIWFVEEENKIAIQSEVNILSDSASFTLVEPEPPFKEGWVDSKGNIMEKYDPGFAFKKQNINYDAVIIHRTILKNLVEKSYGFSFLSKLDVSKIFIVTGGGAVDFLPKDHGLSILPSSILYDFILSRRPAKISLSRLLK